MEKLIHKQEKFQKSLNALSRSIKVFFREDIQDDPEIKENLVASAVKHFEMCYEASWKFLQQYLAYRYHAQIDSPKKIFRECFSRNIIDIETTQELLDISEARNATVHDYDEETAQETCSRINGYYQSLKKLEKLIENL